MPEIVVAAEKRTETGKNVNRRLRVAGLHPRRPVRRQEASRWPSRSRPRRSAPILRSASGENTLFDLDLGGSRRKVILKEYQVEPIKGQLLHADFYEVALDKLLEVKVHVELTGTPVGVKVQGGILDFVTRELEIECLPTDIPEKIVVDVSELELGKHIRVSDLKLPGQGQGPDRARRRDRRTWWRRAPRRSVGGRRGRGGRGAAAAEPEVIKKGKTARARATRRPTRSPEKKEKK